MNIDARLTDTAILTLLGERIARKRLTQNLTQGQLAEQAGLGVRTIQRLEQGAAATQLSGFIRICRVLGLTERLDALVPDEPASPIAQLKHKNQHRRRATGRKKKGSGTGHTWTWGEPQ